MSFNDLGLSPQLVDVVSKQGYDTPSPIQAHAIPEIIAGHDVMAGAQTGTGKTAAFALPIIHCLSQTNKKQNNDSNLPSVRALILTPTRELAQQVYKSVETYAEGSGLSAAIAYGGVSLNPQIDALKKGADILIATPGRLLDLLYKNALVLGDLDFLVFDEADRMLDMGFIKDIRRILVNVPIQRQTLLFSATFDDSIFELSKTLLNEPKLIEVDQRNTAAEQVEQQIYHVDEDKKRELCSYMIGSKNWQQVLVFVRTKQGAEALAKEMSKDGIKTQAIHGDKSQGARNKALAEFKEGKVRALVATDVAARGLDIELLKYVINYELPHVAEDYIHRIGRTGRAGEEGLAVSLMSSDEEWLLDDISEVLGTRLSAQWYPGYEPNLDKKAKPANHRRKSMSQMKKQGRSQAKGGKDNKARSGSGRANKTKNSARR